MSEKKDQMPKCGDPIGKAMGSHAPVPVVQFETIGDVENKDQIEKLLTGMVFETLKRWSKE